MFASAVPASPTVSTTTTTTTPVPQTTPSRPSRLRGLSYLRNYTQHHLSSHSQQSSTTPPPRNSLTQTTSYPGPSTASSEDQNPAPISPTSPSNDWRQGSSAQAETSSSSTQQRTEPAEQADKEGTTSSTLGGISKIMARHRAGNNPQGVKRGQAVPPELGGPVVRPQPRAGRQPQTTIEASTTNTSSAPVESSGLTGLPLDQMPTIKFIPHQDPRAAKPSLQFTATSRTLPHEDCVIRVGRYSERDGNPNPPPNVPSSAPVGFKSKVVSRRHCEFWCSQGQWYIKDVKSSSGTFLNHIRLSQPSVESRPFPVNDGDVVQLGIDFRGGEEMIFRCVKIRIECNRSWQKGLNNFKYGSRIGYNELNVADPDLA